MRNRGYVFTLIIMMLVLVIVSLISYYIIVSQPVIGDTINKMRTDELHYFVEAVETDYGRAVSISGQRAFLYLIDYSIRNGVVFDGYVMQNCTGFNYAGNGSQAAGVELMLCGTFDGDPMLPRDFMENHTLFDWVDKIVVRGDELNFIVEVSIGDVEIIPYDSWNFYVVSRLDLAVYDRLNQSFYRGYDIPVASKVSVEAMEDPLYSLNTGNHALVRYFTPCNTSGVVDAGTVEMWIDSECYQSSSNAPSFFDRLDGNINRSEKYVLQSEKVTGLGLEPRVIGLESLADLDKFASYNVSVGYNLTWVDYYYWNEIPAYCSVIDMESHENFKIDFDHAVSYHVKDLNCMVLADTYFNPSLLSFPVNTTATWQNINPGDTCVLDVNAKGWELTELTPEETYSWVFNETGTYRMNCTLIVSGGDFFGTILVE